MLDIGWQELLVIGVLALLVVGPKELPKLLRTVGQWAGKARSMAREFQRSMDDAAREADLDEFRRIKDLKGEIERGARMDFSEQAKRAQSYMNAPKGGSEAGAGAGQNTGAAAPEASRPNGTAPPAPAETTAPEPRPEAAAPSPDGPKA